MATIEKRVNSKGAISYRAKVRIKGFPQQTATFKGKTKAKDWANRTENAIVEGRHFTKAESKKHTLQDAIERYKREQLPELKDSKHREYHLRWWSEQLGYKVLADLSTAQISECCENLRRTPADYGKHKGKKRSDATVNRYLASLSPVLSVAVKEWGWLDSNPCRNIKRRTESRGRVRYLNDDERQSLLTACEKDAELPELKVIVLIAMLTGARRGEIRTLRWRHVDLQRNRLILEETKNGETRAVPLVGPALDSLKGWAQVRPINNDTYVFPSRVANSSKPLDFDSAWQQVVRVSGIKDFRFHDLRHTAASYLAQSGAGLREIGDILGHKTLAMVIRYSHLCDDHKNATAERMVDTIFGKKK